MITINYDFKNREAEELEQINAILSVMRLRDMKIEGFKGYLETTRDGKGNLLHKRYGIDRGTLICKEAHGNQHGYTYQIDTVVVDDAAGVEGETVLDWWRAAHPDRVIRISITVGYKGSKAYTIAHHEKFDGDDDDSDEFDDDFSDDFDIDFDKYFADFPDDLDDTDFEF